MLLVLMVIGLLTLGAAFMMTNLSRSMSQLSQEQQVLRKEHTQLRVEHMELKQYCSSLETRMKYLERSRQLLSYITKKANIRGSTGVSEESGVRERKVS